MVRTRASSVVLLKASRRSPRGRCGAARRWRGSKFTTSSPRSFTAICGKPISRLEGLARRSRGGPQLRPSSSLRRSTIARLLRLRRWSGWQGTRRHHQRYGARRARPYGGGACAVRGPRWSRAKRFCLRRYGPEDRQVLLGWRVQLKLRLREIPLMRAFSSGRHRNKHC